MQVLRRLLQVMQARQVVMVWRLVESMSESRVLLLVDRAEVVHWLGAGSRGCRRRLLRKGADGRGACRRAGRAVRPRRIGSARI